MENFLNNTGAGGKQRVKCNEGRGECQVAGGSTELAGGDGSVSVAASVGYSIRRDDCGGKEA